MIVHRPAYISNSERVGRAFLIIEIFIRPRQAAGWALLIAILALKFKRLRPYANVLVVVTLMIATCSLFATKLFHRLGPSPNGSYPDMLTATAVTFYGFTLGGSVCAWGPRAVRFALPLTLTMIVIAAVSTVYFKFGWPTDVLGGIFLGIAAACAGLAMLRAYAPEPN